MAIEGTDLELELETLVDRHGLATVLNALQGVCRLKANHIRENWPATNSEGLAKVWIRLEAAVGRAWLSAEKEGL
jgi:hypothetical protein